ncbi:hypothetical protein N8835_05815 [Alphaproteobacteria bacterium]|nr:hypothetical protein [Alphaproteobacteria bacterium]
MTRKSPVYLLCAPNIGVIGAWLPVLRELHDLDPERKIKCLLTKPTILNTVNPTTQTSQLFDQIVFEILVQTSPGKWVRFPSLAEATRRVGTISLKAACDRITLGMPLALAHLLDGVTVHLRNKLLAYKLARLPSTDVEIDPAGVLLYDIAEESKHYNIDVLRKVADCRKFSASHGLILRQEDELPDDLEAPQARHDVTVFGLSNLEIRYYAKRYGIGERHFINIGVFRHDPAWFDYALSRENEPEWSDAVLVISRPSASYFPLQRKRRAYKAIKEVLIEKAGRRVVVQQHPKEMATNLIRSTLGAAIENDKWMFADNHFAKLAESCDFAVCFFSGLSIDLLAQGVVTIEFLDLRGLPEYDNNDAARDETGAPMLSYRQNKVVFGVNSPEELDVMYTRLSNQEPMFDSEALHTRYLALFANPHGSIKRAATLIGEKNV